MKGSLVSAMSKHPLAYLSLITQVGMMMAGPIIGGVYLGRWIDEYFLTEPLFLFIGILGGIVTSFYTLFQMLSRMTK